MQHNGHAPHRTHYVGLAGIAKALNVKPGTVSAWRARYANTNNPPPTPEVWIDETPGWFGTEIWQVWRESLPGQGSGGGALPLVAATRNLGAAMSQLADAAWAAAGAMQGLNDSATGWREGYMEAAQAEGVDEKTAKAAWDYLAEGNPEMPQEELAVMALATLMRGRKPRELPSGD